MTILVYILGGIIALVFFIFISGLLLPSERVVSRKGVFNVSPKVLYELVTDNKNWQYRSGLKDLVILEEVNGIETWDEIAVNGTVIHFKTKEKCPYSFYSFEMKGDIFTGYWTGEFKPVPNGTSFTATEHISIHNPFLKTLSYLFFDIGKFMDTYQEDLKKKVDSLSSHKQ